MARLARIILIARMRMRVRKALVSFGYGWRNDKYLWWGLFIAAALIPAVCYALGYALAGEGRGSLPQLVMLVGGGWLVLGASQPMRLYRQLFVTGSDIFLEQLPVMRQAMLFAHLLSRIVGPAYFTLVVALPFSLGLGGLPAIVPALSLGMLLTPAVLVVEMLSVIFAARLACRQSALSAARLVRLASLTVVLFSLPMVVSWLLFPSGTLAIPKIDPMFLARVAWLSSFSLLWAVCFLALLVTTFTIGVFGMYRLVPSFRSASDPSPDARRLSVVLAWLVRIRRAEHPFLMKDALHLSRSDYLAVGSIPSRMVLVAAPILGGLFALRHFSSIPKAIVIGVACAVLYFLKDLILDCVLMPVIAIENDLAAVHLFWRRNFTLWQILRDKWTLIQVATTVMLPLDFVIMALFCGSFIQALMLALLLLVSSQVAQLVALGVATVFFQPGYERVEEAGHSQKAEIVGIVCSAPLMSGLAGMLWLLLGVFVERPLMQFTVLAAFVALAGSLGLLIVRYLSIKRLSEIYVY